MDVLENLFQAALFVDLGGSQRVAVHAPGREPFGATMQSVISHECFRKREFTAILTVGIDLAKNGLRCTL